MKFMKLCILGSIAICAGMLSNCAGKAELAVHQKDSIEPVSTQTSLSDEEFAKRYNYWRDKLHLDKGLDHIMQRAREFKKEGKDKYPFNYYWFKDELLISREIDEAIEEFGVTVRVEKQGIRMSFTPDGVLSGFTNELVMESGKIYNWEISSEKITPNESKEEILKQAEQYRDELLGERMKKHSLGPVREIYFDDGPPWIGVWKITWPRIMNGYEVQNDYISIYIHEKYGLCAFADVFLSDPCPVNIKIGQENAEQIALKLAQEFIDETLPRYNSKYPPGIKINPKAEVGWTKFMIVQPEKLSVVFRRKETRLAYQVVIKWCEDEKEWRNKIFRVNIDVETGEILGRNFPHIHCR